MEGDPRAEADWNHIRALYNGEMAFTDKAVGQLLDGLSVRGLKENTLVVFLSDHGHTLFDELTRVPLVFSLPGVLPSSVTVGDQVRLLDVLPTVLDLMGIKQESYLEGVSLKPLLAGDGCRAESKTALLSGKFAYFESVLYGSEKKAVTAYPWKLIYDTVTGDRMLYNLAHDPAEQRNVAESLPEAGKVLDEVLCKTVCGISETWYVELLVLVWCR